VVTATRQDPEQLSGCVRSVLEQTYANWQLLLVDARPPDAGSTPMLDGPASADPRIIPLTAGGGDAAGARNGALRRATGDIVMLLEETGRLVPRAVAEVVAAFGPDVDVVYADEDALDPDGRRAQPQFKPDWDPDLLLSCPYLGHPVAVRRNLLRTVGGFRQGFQGAEHYDVLLRVTEAARQVVHLPKVLYHEASTPGAEPSPLDPTTARRALEDAMARQGIAGRVEPGPFPGTFNLRRAIDGTPTVSVIIPFRDQAALTVQCLASLEISPGHPIEEVVLIDNGSTEPETRALRQGLADRPRTRILDYPGPFNWSAVNNLAAATCRSDLLLFLNNDIEAASDGWLAALVEHVQRPEIGAVGARLLYPDGRVQHAGVVLAVGGIATHIFSGLPPDGVSYLGWDRMVRSYSAVTGACMAVRREVFEELGGFDEGLPVAFNDVDFCIRLGRAGYRVLYTPHAELTHYESVSRGLSGYQGDFAGFLARWWDVLRQDDPYYNRNLGRFEPWCALRLPGADERWLAEVGARVPDDMTTSPTPRV
jgi:GT2 family glycosyltransferase